MRRIYLDHAATTPVHPDVRAAMLPYLTDQFGNPSSIHFFGQEAKSAIEGAREKVISLIGAGDDEIVFTSGGTESNNFAIKGAAYANEHRGNHIITSSIEHHAVIEPLKFLEKRGFEVSYIPVDHYGLVDPRDVSRAIKQNTVLISIMHANNEIGTIEPIAEIGCIARERGIYFHTDAVQTAGHIPVNVNELGVDLLSMSAHKLYGPKGVGALYIRKGTRIVPLVHGGEQENKRRASTENVPGIVGFGKAVEIAWKDMDAEAKRQVCLRDELVKGLRERISDIELYGHPTRRLPNNVNLGVQYIEGESMILNLDMEGVAAATGSACSSSSLQPSHVLMALGLAHERAHGSLRFTLGKGTTDGEISRVLEVLPPIVHKLRSMSPLVKSGLKTGRLENGS